jgi:hypothetical protein
MSSPQGSAIADAALSHSNCSSRGPTPDDVARYTELIIRPSDPATVPARAYYLQNQALSTCGLTVLGCWRLAGLPDAEAQGPYYPGRIGRAFADMEAVAARYGCWEPGPPRGLLLAGDVWIIVDDKGGDAHTGLCVADQDPADPAALKTVEGGQFDGKGSTAIGSFSRKLVQTAFPAGRVMMGSRHIYGVIRAAGLPIPVISIRASPRPVPPPTPRTRDTQFVNLAANFRAFSRIFAFLVTICETFIPQG